MSTRAFGAANVAAATLEAAVAELSSILNEAEKTALDAVQETWSDFRDRQADWAALIVAGGSMEPLIRSSEKESLTLQRLAQVRAAIDERRRVLV